MAYEINTNIADLAVVDTYLSLMKASTGKDSAYIRAKETLTALFEDSSMSEVDRSNTIAKTISEIANNITTVAMNTAVQIAKENRDAPYTLGKIKEDTALIVEQTNLVVEETTKVVKEVELAELTVKNSTYSGWKLQAELYRDYGVQTYNLTVANDIVPLTQFSDYGLKVETLNKAKVDTYATYSSAYRTNGVVTYTVDQDTGKMLTAASADNDVKAGLTHAQTKLAIRNEQGFNDNQRQHVVNSSATMMSMLLSTDAEGIDYSPYLTQYSIASNYLNTSHSADIGLAGSVNIIPPAAILQVDVAYNITGTTLNIATGSSVIITLTNQTDGSAPDVYGDPAEVGIGGTWATTIPANKTGDLIADDVYKIRASVMDSTGVVVYDEFLKLITA